MIPHDEVQLLWETNCWDGTLSGYARWRGVVYYYSMSEENDDREGDWYRRYKLFPLTQRELADAEERHEVFRRYVGTHCDFVEGKRGGGSVTRQPEWKHFYEKYPPESFVPPTSTPVGWFEI